MNELQSPGPLFRRGGQISAFLAVSICLSLILSGFTRAIACPFCSAVSQTFAEEISSLDAAVLVKLVKYGKRQDEEEDDGYAATPRSEFEVWKFSRVRSMCRLAIGSRRTSLESHTTGPMS